MSLSMLPATFTSIARKQSMPTLSKAGLMSFSYVASRLSVRPVA